MADAFGLGVVPVQREVVQFGKDKLGNEVDDGEGGEGSEQQALVQDGAQENALVVAGNFQQNLQLLQSAFSKLPKRVQAYLLRLKAQLEGKGEEDDERAIVLRRQQDPFAQILSMDPERFATILLGLKVMPETEVLPTALPGIRELFFTLATARYSFDTALPMLENGDPVQVEASEHRGVEHVQNSCYAASILNLIAAVPAYRRLFSSRLNETRQGSEARLLQDAIAPMLRTLGHNDTVPAGQVRQLLAVLNGLRILQGGDVGEQQDASQVLMEILQRVQPARDQLLTAHRTEFKNPDKQNVNRTQVESEAVLQLTAVGHPTLEEALVAYFTIDRRAGGDVHNPHTTVTRAVRFPAVLSIGMLRQSGRDHIDMPEVFRVPAAITGNGRPGPRYRLQAFIVRNTFSHFSGGHYVAVMRDGQGGWAESDDMGKGKKDEPGVWTPSTRTVDVNTHTVGDHTAPAYALATLYTYVLDEEQGDDAPDRVSFDSTWTLGEDEISKFIFQPSSKLGPKDALEREKLTRDFIRKGGRLWHAFDILRNAKNNSELAATFELYLGGRKEREKRSREEVVSKNRYYDIFKNHTMSELLGFSKRLPGLVAEAAQRAPDQLGPFTDQLEAVTVLLREREEALLGGADYGLLLSDSNESGTTLEMYGTANLTKSAGRKLDAWIHGVSAALLGSAFISSRDPPLHIRIRLRPEVTSDIASTSSEGNRITINLDDYQVTEFTIGQTIGLLAHEIGVHSLDDSTLTPKELEEEAKDKDSKHTGKHQGETFTIGADPKLKKQQVDHLTIGRGVLGQLSALPRLNMYESTMISLIEVLPDAQDRWEAAAAYCIDIARILVTNDDPTELKSSGYASQALGGWSIATAAANEWMRVRAKYPKNKVVNSIEIGRLDIIRALFTLVELLNKVKKEAKK